MILKRLLIIKNHCSNVKPLIIQQFLGSFPFFKMNKSFTEDLRNVQSQSYQKKQAIAFLSLVKPALAQKLVNKADNNQEDSIVGKQIFALQFQGKLCDYANQILNTKNNRRRLIALKVLFYMDKSQELKRAILMLKQIKIKDLTQLELIFYIGCLIKTQNEYLNEVQLLYNLMKINKNHEVGLILFFIPNYQEYFSHSILTYCLQAITNKIEIIAEMDLINLMSHLYSLKSKPSKQIVSFIQTLTQVVLKRQNTEESDIPLTLKLIKLRSHFRMDKQVMQQIVKANPRRFFLIFRQSDYNKEVILPLMLNQQGQILEELRPEFQKYIKAQIQYLKTSDEINLQKTIRTFRLILKYFINIPLYMKQQMANITVEIIKRFDNVEILYYGVILLFRAQINQSEELFFADMIVFSNKLLPIIMKNQDISKVLNLSYQVFRKKLEKKIQIGNIFTLNYQNSKLAVQEMGYFFYLLKKVKAPEEHKRSAVNQIKGFLMNDLSNGNIKSIKTVFTIIDSLNAISYNDDKYVWVNIQKAIEIIIRKNNKIYMQKKDILFLNNLMVKKNLGSRKFKEFILATLNDFSSIDKNAEIYLEKAEKHTIWRQRDKRNIKDLQ